MSPALRKCFRVICCLAALGLLSAGEQARAQSQVSSSTTATQQSTQGPRKPTRKPDQVLTDDSVALLAVRRAPRILEPSGTLVPATESGEANPAMDEKEKRAAEIARLESQIREKQKQIALLMRLFVNDERTFLNDPGNTRVEETARERRKYEQDELLWETAQLAQMKARLNELTAAK